MASQKIRRLNDHTWCMGLDDLLTGTPEVCDSLVNYVSSTVNVDNVFIGSLTWEYYDIQCCIHYLERINRACKLVLILDESYRCHSDQLRDIQTVFIDFFALKSWYEVYIRKSSNLNPGWNHSNAQFLFPTGKPNKLHRLGLLYRFFKQGLLNRCKWSLIMPKNLWKPCHRYVDLPFDQYQSFVLERLQTVDGIPIKSDDNSVTPINWPYDGKELYGKTCIKVISETHMNSHTCFITEKTYDTILNRQPFIIAGDLGSLKELRRKGFNTFENYLKIQNYDHIENPSDRLDAVVENVEFFLDTYHQHIDSIGKDIEQNVATMEKLIEHNLLTLTTLQQSLNIKEHSVWTILPFAGALDTWVLFYYNIKDQSWPDCYNEKDFYLLPKYIQQECVETFGYSPKI